MGLKGPGPAGQRGHRRRRTDPVVVVGGGAVGLCVAHYLARGRACPSRWSTRAASARAPRGATPAGSAQPLRADSRAGRDRRYVLRSLGRPGLAAVPAAVARPGARRWALRFWRSSRRSQFERGYAALAELNRPHVRAVRRSCARPGSRPRCARPASSTPSSPVDAARDHLDVQRHDGGRGLRGARTTSRRGDEVRALDATLGPGVAAGYLVRRGGARRSRPLRGRRSRSRWCDAGGRVREKRERHRLRARAAARVTALRHERGRAALPRRRRRRRHVVGGAAARPRPPRFRCRPARATASRSPSPPRRATRSTSATSASSSRRSTAARGSPARWS